MITDDTRVPVWPIQKDHVKAWDKNKTAMFTRHHGERAAEVDRKLGIDYQLYHAMNLQAQRATLKCMDMQRRIQASLPGTGLGQFDKLNNKIAAQHKLMQSTSSSGSRSFNAQHNVSTSWLRDPRRIAAPDS